METHFLLLSVLLAAGRRRARMGEGKADLLPADEKGRMVFLGEYPLAGFEPGPYEAVAKVKQGASATQDRAAFIIVP